MMVIAPAISLAQPGHDGPVTRAQVLQELVDLESVGYYPAMANEVNYPENVQAAMRRLEAKRASEARLAQQQDLAQSGYGAEPVQTGESSGPALQGGGEPTVYLHH
jgi:hypothetical protein